MNKFYPITSAAIIALCAIQSSARAESTAEQRALASQLFDEAQSLFSANKAEEACPKYAESQRLDPQLGTLLYLADCYDRIGKTASAWSSFRDAIEIATQRGDDREAAARARLAEIETHLSRITITIAPGVPSDVEIKQDGQVIGNVVLGVPVPVDPGKHVVTATASGFKPQVRETDVPMGPSNVKVLMGPLEPEPPQASLGTAPSANRTTEPSPALMPTVAVQREPVADTHPLMRPLAFTLAGLGAVSTGVGIVFAARMSAKVSDRTDANACSSGDGCSQSEVRHIRSLTDDARDDARVANVCFIAGAAALVGAVASYWIGSQTTSERTTHTARATPWFGQHSAGLSFEGSL